ncbi:MAG TPA: CHAD domain-containing protein [Candidatus Acidoferrales bacterium]|nr:CHAD domain-containing protein [Candidatus Acidoferrales bacterium]
MDRPSKSHSFGKSGLAHWMRRAVKERARAAARLDPDAVHDLRVALRHCLSFADAATEFDPHSGWKSLKHSAKQLLKHLGHLRDSQVLLHWLDDLGFSTTAQGQALKESLFQQESRLCAEAHAALADFDLRKWKSWAKQLAPRAEPVLPGSPAAQYLALERWTEAYRLHRFALRSRSKISFHRLRIAIKDFRYSLEFFLPDLHAAWVSDLKYLQDALGERHDLDVLWRRVANSKSLDEITKTEWRERIVAGQQEHLAQYLAKTKGKTSLWLAWRAALPQGERLDEAALAALAAWSSFRAPDFDDSRRVAGLALTLFDAFAARSLAGGFPTSRPRTILQAAALLQEVGRSKRAKGYHKTSYRMIRQLPLPIGWQHGDLELTSLVARYHRKALPQLKHKEFRALPASSRHATLFLVGILRLANCFAHSAGTTIRKFELDLTPEGIVIQAYGFEGGAQLVSKLADAKHLLEIACRRSILIIPGAAGAPLRVAAAGASPSPAKPLPVRALRAHA